MEAFVVCRGFEVPEGFDVNQFELCLSGVYSPQQFHSEAESHIVPFLACGDLSGYDSDKSYPLESLVYQEPVQQPLHPPYDEYQQCVKEGLLEGAPTELLEGALEELPEGVHEESLEGVAEELPEGAVSEELPEGAAPEKWMLDAGEYTMKRFAALYGMQYGGMATNRNEGKRTTKQRTC